MFFYFGATCETLRFKPRVFIPPLLIGLLAGGLCIICHPRLDQLLSYCCPYTIMLPDRVRTIIVLGPLMGSPYIIELILKFIGRRADDFTSMSRFSMFVQVFVLFTYIGISTDSEADSLGDAGLKGAWLLIGVSAWFCIMYAAVRRFLAPGGALTHWLDLERGRREGAARWSIIFLAMLSMIFAGITGLNGVLSLIGAFMFGAASTPIRLPWGWNVRWAAERTNAIALPILYITLGALCVFSEVSWSLYLYALLVPAAFNLTTAAVALLPTLYFYPHVFKTNDEIDYRKMTVAALCFVAQPVVVVAMLYDAISYGALVPDVIAVTLSSLTWALVLSISLRMLVDPSTEDQIASLKEEVRKAKTIVFERSQLKKKTHIDSKTLLLQRMASDLVAKSDGRIRNADEIMFKIGNIAPKFLRPGSNFRVVQYAVPYPGIFTPIMSEGLLCEGVPMNTGDGGGRLVQFLFQVYIVPEDFEEKTVESCLLAGFECVCDDPEYAGYRTMLLDELSQRQFKTGIRAITSETAKDRFSKIPEADQIRALEFEIARLDEELIITEDESVEAMLERLARRLKERDEGIDEHQLQVRLAACRDSMEENLPVGAATYAVQSSVRSPMLAEGVRIAAPERTEEREAEEKPMRLVQILLIPAGTSNKLSKEYCDMLREAVLHGPEYEEYRLMYREEGHGKDVVFTREAVTARFKKQKQQG